MKSHLILKVFWKKAEDFFFFNMPPQVKCHKFPTNFHPFGPHVSQPAWGVTYVSHHGFPTMSLTRIPSVRWSLPNPIADSQTSRELTISPFFKGDYFNRKYNLQPLIFRKHAFRFSENNSRERKKSNHLREVWKIIDSKVPRREGICDTTKNTHQDGLTKKTWKNLKE